MSNVCGQRHFKSTSEVCQSQFSGDCKDETELERRDKVITNNRLNAGNLVRDMWVGFSYGCQL